MKTATLDTVSTSPVKSVWGLDKAHSHIHFKVKHLMISTVSGTFDDFAVTVKDGKGDFDHASIVFEAQSGSINTNNSQRDAHLRSADFFDSENFPVIRFESDELIKTGRFNFTLTGRLSIKGVTKAVMFETEFGGIATDPWGNTKAGFELTGKIRRSDFGLTWNAPLEAGGVVVADEIKIQADIQLIKTTN